MLIRNFGRVFAPETGAGSDEGEAEQQQRAPVVEREEKLPDGPGSGRSALRKDLEKNFREAKAPEPKGKERARDGKYVSQRQKQAAEEGGEEQEEQVEGKRPVEGGEAEVEAEGGEQEQQEGGEQEQAAVEAPKAWSKEAKAEWANIPPVAQAAIAKRESDTEKGVAALKKNYAEIDQAIQPRAELIRQNGHTPGAAVNQLFAWFEALSQDTQRIKNGQPPVAAVALLQSFGIDPRIVAGMQAPLKDQEQDEGGEQEQQEGALPPAVKAELDGLRQQLSDLTGNIDHQRQYQTMEILSQWSNGKPYFEEVRPVMAHLLASGLVPPLPGNRADLDKAYDMALYAHPEVRVKVLADQRKKEEADKKAAADKERKAQQDQANKSRRAAVGLGPSAPGNEPGTGDKKGKRTSVRDSISQAVKELSEI